MFDTPTINELVTSISRRFRAICGLIEPRAPVCLFNACSGVLLGFEIKRRQPFIHLAIDYQMRSVRLAPIENFVRQIGVQVPQFTRIHDDRLSSDDEHDVVIRLDGYVKTNSAVFECEIVIGVLADVSAAAESQ